jgi:biotin operon repressor
MGQGYIKLARCLLEKPLFQNEKLLKVWIWCLLKASHKGYEQLIGLKKIQLESGQFIFGREKAAQELNMPQSTVWRLMQFLKDNESLDIKTNNKYSLVTLINWTLYQVEPEKTDSKMDSKRTTDGQQMDTNKNVKNDKNDYILCYTSNEKLIEAIKEFTKMRNKIKKPMTDRALTMMLNKLDKFSTDDNEKIKILNQSILKCWQDIYEIDKDGDKHGKRLYGNGKQKAGRNPSEVDWAADGDL